MKEVYSLLYSTQQRGTSGLLRGHYPNQNVRMLSKRHLKWLSMKKIMNEKRLQGLLRNPAEAIFSVPCAARSSATLWLFNLPILLQATL